MLKRLNYNEMLLLSYAITRVCEPLDGFVCAVMEGCQVSSSVERSQITLVDDVMHGEHLATVKMRETA